MESILVIMLSNQHSLHSSSQSTFHDIAVAYISNFHHCFTNLPFHGQLFSPIVVVVVVAVVVVANILAVDENQPFIPSMQLHLNFL